MGLLHDSDCILVSDGRAAALRERGLMRMMFYML